MKIKTKTYVDQQAKHVEKLMYAELNADRRAVEKALASMERRLDGMNEFRTTLKDQAATFVTRRELLAAIITILTLIIGATAVIISFFK